MKKIFLTSILFASCFGVMQNTEAGYEFGYKLERLIGKGEAYYFARESNNAQKIINYIDSLPTFEDKLNVFKLHKGALLLGLITSGDDAKFATTWFLNFIAGLNDKGKILQVFNVNKRIVPSFAASAPQWMIEFMDSFGSRQEKLDFLNSFNDFDLSFASCSGEFNNFLRRNNIRKVGSMYR